MLSIPIVSEPLGGDVPRRSSSRQRIESLVYADFGPGNGGFPINLGEGGMAFQGIQPLEQGQIISTRVKLPGSNDVLETTCRVAWLNELGKGGGLQFIELSEASRDLILRWCSLQTQPGNRGEPVQGTPPQFEGKEISPSVALPKDACEDKTSDKTEADCIVQVPSEIPPPVLLRDVAANLVSTPELPPVSEAAQSNIQRAATKRAWVVPLTIGVFVLAIALIALMSYFGVISVQFRWPLTANSSMAQSKAEPRASQTPGVSSQTTTDGLSTDGPARGQNDLAATPNSAAHVPEAKPPVQDSPASEATPQTTESPAEIHSPKIPSPFVATARPIKPNPVKPVAPAGLTPPSIAPPIKLEESPQLAMISPGAPAPPVTDSPQKSAKFDPPQLVTRKNPVYPTVAKATGISGSVELQFTVTAEGKVRDVTTTSGNPILARAAVEAVKAWRYRPARLGGVPVESQSTTIFNFKPN